MIKKLMKVIVIITAVLAILAGYPAAAQVMASEIPVIKFMTAMQNIDAKAEPDRNAETIFSYEAGATALVTGETQDGWYIVYYQGKTGYVDQNTPVDPDTYIGADTSDAPNASQEVLVEQELDIEALNEEMEALQIENQIIVEEVERYRAEARRSKIWGTIIVLLVIAIFAVGIVSTVRGEKKKKENQDNSEDRQENDHNRKEQPQEDHNGEEQLQEGYDREEQRQGNNSRKGAYKGNIIDLDKE